MKPWNYKLLLSPLTGTTTSLYYTSTIFLTTPPTFCRKEICGKIVSQYVYSDGQID